MHPSLTLSTAALDESARLQRHDAELYALETLATQLEITPDPAGLLAFANFDGALAAGIPAVEGFDGTDQLALEGIVTELRVYAQRIRTAFSVSATADATYFRHIEQNAAEFHDRLQSESAEILHELPASFPEALMTSVHWPIHHADDLTALLRLLAGNAGMIKRVGALPIPTTVAGMVAHLNKIEEILAPYKKYWKFINQKGKRLYIAHDLGALSGDPAYTQHLREGGDDKTTLRQLGYTGTPQLQAMVRLALQVANLTPMLEALKAAFVATQAERNARHGRGETEGERVAGQAAHILWIIGRDLCFAETIKALKAVFWSCEVVANETRKAHAKGQI